MSDRLQVLDELERRLIETHYRRRRPSRMRLWLSVASAAAAVVVVVVAVLLAVLPGGEVAPSPASAALDRAARGSLSNTASSDGALGPGRIWQAWIVSTFRTTELVLPRTGPPYTDRLPRVAVLTRLRELFRVSRDGRVTVRRQQTTSFVHPSVARRDRLQPATGDDVTYTFNGHGQISSPLATFTPLFTYRQLRALPSSPVHLRQVIAEVQRKLSAPGPPVTEIHESPKPALPVRRAPTFKGKGQVRTIPGACCGTSPQAERDRGDLRAIAMLLTMPIKPAVRAGLYHLAATLPGVRFDGVATDALGRRGAEVSLGRGATQLRMIFNERTGALLATRITYPATAFPNGLFPQIQTVQSLRVVSAR